MVYWPIRALSPDEMVQKGVAQLLEAVIDDVGNFVNHSFATPLRVVVKERYSILSGGC